MRQVSWRVLQRECRGSRHVHFSTKNALMVSTQQIVNSQRFYRVYQRFLHGTIFLRPPHLLPGRITHRRPWKVGTPLPRKARRARSIDELEEWRGDPHVSELLVLSFLVSSCCCEMMWEEGEGERERELCVLAFHAAPRHSYTPKL